MTHGRHHRLCTGSHERCGARANPETTDGQSSEIVDTRRLRVDVVTAEKEQLTYQGFLAELLLAECDDRTRRRSVRRVNAAGFPQEKWLGDFDFDFDATPSNSPRHHEQAG